VNIGQTIKEARMAKGITQEELGKLVGVQKSAVAKWENGRVVNIKRSTLQKLAIALDIKGSDLIEDIAPVQEKPVNDDELTESQRILIDFAKTLSEEQAGKVLQLMKSILAFDK
jgi:transcriptional regulator with XRE-family HTH domain